MKKDTDVGFIKEASGWNRDTHICPLDINKG
jgi:hypothetical protein